MVVYTRPREQYEDGEDESDYLAYTKPNVPPVKYADNSEILGPPDTQENASDINENENREDTRKHVLSLLVQVTSDQTPCATEPVDYSRLENTIET